MKAQFYSRQRLGNYPTCLNKPVGKSALRPMVREGGAYWGGHGTPQLVETGYGLSRAHVFETAD